MPLRIGEVFAGYRVLRLLGSGGMGEVYLVQHPRLPRQEALKVLRPDISSDPSFRERFIREADLAAGLRHPHIVGIHDRGENDGQLWIAMDYIDGTDLAHLLARRYPAGMPIDLVVPVVTAAASALDYAHKKGLLHRDVKPANIMVADLDTDDPQVFLTDFGIARPLNDPSGLTATNMTVGTVAYAAPEQLMGEPMDGRADEYALAATAYHLLTGLQLFTNSNPAVVISHHLNAAPPVLADMRPELSALDRALAVALSKSPAERFPYCSDFARALADQSEVPKRDWTRTATQPAPAAGKPSGEAAPPAPATEVKQSPKGWVIAGCVLALIALISAITFVVWHPWQERDSRGDAPSASSTRRPPPLTSSTHSEPPSTAASPSPPPARTQAVTIAPVVDGQPANGYEEVPNAASPTHISDVFGCGGSTAAAAANIYACLPSAAGADICWPATTGTLLCVEDPWTRGLFRVTVTDQLDYAAPQPNPLPFAVLLDNGGRCRLYASGPRTKRDDGWFGVYSCSGGNAILVEEDAWMRGDFSEAIDRSQPFWMVQVGPPGPDSVHFPPPETRTVVTAWFAGN